MRAGKARLFDTVRPAKRVTQVGYRLQREGGAIQERRGIVAFGLKLFPEIQSSSPFSRMSIGYGIYARTRRSSVTGNLIPEKSLPELSEEALKKLGVKVVPTRAERAYNAGLSTQVPTGRVIGVRGRVSRKISYNGTSIAFERTA